MRPTALILLAAAQAALVAAQDASTNCTRGLYMIVARATGESPGTGRVGAVARNVSAAIPESHIEAIVYPATYVNYTTSEADGVKAMTQAIKDRVAACPDDKIALLGYSQGAQVSADTLCGTDDGSAFADTPDLGPEFGGNIVAVVMFGDPSHSMNASFNAGNATRDGVSLSHTCMYACSKS
jgi:acetylxylan esterase